MHGDFLESPAARRAALTNRAGKEETSPRNRGIPRERGREGGSLRAPLEAASTPRREVGTPRETPGTVPRRGAPGLRSPRDKAPGDFLATPLAPGPLPRGPGGGELLGRSFS